MWAKALFLQKENILFSEEEDQMDSKQLKVGDVMSAGVSTLGRNDKLSIAEDLMKQERIRHLPVIDDDSDLCGIITQRDMFRGALVRALGFGSRAED